MEIWEQGGHSRPLRPEEKLIDGASMVANAPALKGDPYHPESVTERQNKELASLRERMQSTGREAERLD